MWVLYNIGVQSYWTFIRLASHVYRVGHDVWLLLQRLLIQSNEVLVEVLDLLCHTKTRIDWLQQLALKLKTEIQFITTLLDKTDHLIASTQDCYTKLDKVSSISPVV